MAKINLKNVILIDKWPGVPNPLLGIPAGGFDASTVHSCVTTAASSAVYHPGEKIQAYQDDGSQHMGYYTMIYLRYHEASGNNTITEPSSNYCFVQHADMTFGTDGTSCWWNVANCAGISTDATYTGRFAIMCNTGITGDTTLGTKGAAGQWGWGWCGGVCPYVDLTMFDFSAGAGRDVTVGSAITHPGFINVNVDTSVLVLGGTDNSTCACGISGAASA